MVPVCSSQVVPPRYGQGLKLPEGWVVIWIKGAKQRVVGKECGIVPLLTSALCYNQDLPDGPLFASFWYDISEFFLEIVDRQFILDHAGKVAVAAL